MRCAVQIYRVLGGFHVYKSVFLGWVVGRFNIAVNGEHNCGVPPIVGVQCNFLINMFVGVIKRLAWSLRSAAVT